MPKQKFTNNAKGRLNAGITNVATALTLGAGQGALFPNPTNGDSFKATLIKSNGSLEIVRVTARTGDSFDTMVRAQEGTAALAFDANDRVELRLTAGGMEAHEQIPEVQTITGDVTLDESDINTTQIITDEADIELPDSATLATHDRITFKSMTEESVTITTQGGDLHDGQAAGAPYRLPSYCSVTAVKTSAGNYVLLGRPECYVGKVEFYPVSAAAPLGYVLGEGQAESRTTRGGLFAVYGTTHGVGDGATTFNVPDMKGRMPMGSGTGTTAETVAAADVSVANNDFTVASNDDKWKTGMKVQITTTGGLPAGLNLATDYYVVRDSATKIRLATTLANAQLATPTVVDLTSQGTGDHTLTHTMLARAVGQKGGAETHAQKEGEESPHLHDQTQTVGNNNAGSAFNNFHQAFNVFGDNSGPTARTAGGLAMNITNPHLVGKWIIKT